MATKKSNVGTAVAIGVSIAALSAAGYLLMGPDGKKNRKNLKAWMVKMKAEIAEKIEGMEEVTAPIYEKIVHEIGKKYQSAKNIDPHEVQKEIENLKKMWKKMTPGTVKKAAKKKVASVKKSVQKVAKKKSR